MSSPADALPALHDCDTQQPSRSGATTAMGPCADLSPERKPSNTPTRCMTRVSESDNTAFVSSLPESQADVRTVTAKSCHEIIEKDGGCYGCTLQPFHLGPHQNTLSTKTRQGRKPEQWSEAAPPRVAPAPARCPLIRAAPSKESTTKLVRAAMPRPAERAERPAPSQPGSKSERARSAPRSRARTGAITPTQSPAEPRRETGRERKPVARLVPNSGGGLAKRSDPGSCLSNNTRVRPASSTPITAVPSASAAPLVVQSPPSAALAPLDDKFAEAVKPIDSPSSPSSSIPKPPRKPSGVPKVRVVTQYERSTSLAYNFTCNYGGILACTVDWQCTRPVEPSCIQIQPPPAKPKVPLLDRLLKATTEAYPTQSGCAASNCAPHKALQPGWSAPTAGDLRTALTLGTPTWNACPCYADKAAPPQLDSSVIDGSMQLLPSTGYGSFTFGSLGSGLVDERDLNMPLNMSVPRFGSGLSDAPFPSSDSIMSAASFEGGRCDAWCHVTANETRRVAEWKTGSPQRLSRQIASEATLRYIQLCSSPIWPPRTLTTRTPLLGVQAATRAH